MTDLPTWRRRNRAKIVRAFRAKSSEVRRENRKWAREFQSLKRAEHGWYFFPRWRP